MVRHLISVHRSSWLDWKYDQNWTEPNCKGLDHQLWLPWSWIFLVASPKVWQKKERLVWTSCNWSFHSIYQLAPTTTNNLDNPSSSTTHTNHNTWPPLPLPPSGHHHPQSLLTTQTTPAHPDMTKTMCQCHVSKWMRPVRSMQHDNNNGASSDSDDTRCHHCQH